MAHADDGNWFGQPKGLTILFLTEMWEKFSFFGMRALQLYYMTKQLHFSQANASLVYGAYAAGVYLTPIIGGVVADRWLGRRRAVVTGGLLMALGHFMMASEVLFFPAMAMIAIGNGLFLPSLPSQIALLYPAHDPRRVSALHPSFAARSVKSTDGTTALAPPASACARDWRFTLAGRATCRPTHALRGPPPCAPRAARARC